LLNQRLTKQEVAVILKTGDVSISFLIGKRLLKVLGHPVGNKRRPFSAAELFNAMQDRKWLSKITDALYELNESKNAQSSYKESSSHE
jgi:hypothetical protein